MVQHLLFEVQKVRPEAHELVVGGHVVEDFDQPAHVAAEGVFGGIRHVPDQDFGPFTQARVFVQAGVAAEDAEVLADAVGQLLLAAACPGGGGRECGS